VSSLSPYDERALATVMLRARNRAGIPVYVEARAEYEKLRNRHDSR
jgi:hypothetical protein